MHYPIYRCITWLELIVSLQIFSTKILWVEEVKLPLPPTGGAVGGLLGCWLASGQFKPLPQIIMELSPQQQQKLYGDVMVILGEVQWTDVAQLTALVMGNSTMKQQITGALLGYVTR